MTRLASVSFIILPLAFAAGCSSEPSVTPPPRNDSGTGMDAAMDVPPADVPPKPVDAGPLPNLVPIVIAGNEPWLAELPAMIRSGYGFRPPRIETRTFSAGSCEVQEGCTLPGQRRLLRFTLATPNRGNADLYLGPPTTEMRPDDRFEFSACHNHFHLRGYADYRLVDANGREVARGHKQSFCIEDTNQDPNAPINPETGERFNASLDRAEAYGCRNQGLHAGWLDAYGQHLECQYIDITGVPEGRYRIRAAINSDRVLVESDYSDNVSEIDVDIPAVSGNPPPLTPLDACTTSETGMMRECGWTTEPDPRHCTAGEMVTIGCNPACADGGGGGRCEGNPVVRVCASTQPCAQGSAGCMPSLPYCSAAEALAVNDDSCGTQCSQVTFPCPASGYYRVLTGAFNSGEAYACRLPFSMTTTP